MSGGGYPARRDEARGLAGGGARASSSSVGCDGLTLVNGAVRDPDNDPRTACQARLFASHHRSLSYKRRKGARHLSYGLPGGGPKQEGRRKRQVAASERLAVKDEELPRVLANGPRGGLLLPLLGAELVDGRRADGRVLKGVLEGERWWSASESHARAIRCARTLAVRSSEYISWISTVSTSAHEGCGRQLASVGIQPDSAASDAPKSSNLKPPSQAALGCRLMTLSRTLFLLAPRSLATATVST
jgi:hypothetical protein